MADREVVIQPVLCFLLKRYGKSDINRLKTVTLHFFTPEAIANAKTMLLNDVEKLCIENTPHIARHRESVTRNAKDVDDIIIMAQFLDEKKLFDKLPRYASDDPADLPTLNIVDGDMFVILSKLAAMENSMSVMQYGINGLNALYHMHANTHVSQHSAGPGQLGNSSQIGRDPRLNVHNSSATRAAAATAKYSSVGKPVTRS